MRHSNPVLQTRFFSAEKCIANCAAGAFVWREIASLAAFEKNNNDFEDDLYDKTQSQFMNKSTNMKSKEREIERDRENRRQRSEVRRERERLRAVANRRNMSDEQREKEQERVPEKTCVAAQGLSISFHIGLQR